VTNEEVIVAMRLFVALLGVAVVVALLARRISLPYSVALVVAGLVVGRVVGATEFDVPPQLVLAVLLPGLIFEAALRTGFEDLRPSLVGVAVLAVPGVLVVAVVVGWIVSMATGMEFGSAFLVGAMVAATDPAAVVGTFRRIHAPRQLSTIVEAESLLNDGTGIVLFAIAVTAIRGQASAGQGAVDFAITVLGSAIIGAGAGLLASRVMTRVRDHLVELAISVVLAYGCYLLADALHESGIIATVVAGLTLGTYGRSHGLSEAARETIDQVWEFLAFLLTAIVFLLLGVAISLPAVLDAALVILWAVVAVLVARALVVYVLLGGVSRLLAGRLPRAAGGRALPLPWLHVLFWAGLRGVVSVALALSLPVDTPNRGLLQGTVFGVVLFTLIVQGSTADMLVTRVLAPKSRRAAPVEE
jgi:CPA1 family monovalent cation:H+ antiporter